MNNTKPIGYFLALLLMLSLSGHGSAGQDFRQRLSHNQQASVDDIESDVQAEIEFGREVAARILGKHKLVGDYQLTKYINLVGRSIAVNTNRPELEFYFGVIETDQVNAYTAPGGYVFITRGALKIMQSEDELAAVLAHEIAHVTQMHIVNELDIKGTEQGLSAGLTRLLGGATDTARVAFSQAIDQAVSLLFDKGLKQKDEFEADQVGTMLALSAGYDPSALYRYLGRVRHAKARQLTVVKQTHPPFEQRLVALATLIRAESLNGVKGTITQSRFGRYIQ